MNKSNEDDSIPSNPAGDEITEATIKPSPTVEEEEEEEENENKLSSITTTNGATNSKGLFTLKC